MANERTAEFGYNSHNKILACQFAHFIYAWGGCVKICRFCFRRCESVRFFCSRLKCVYSTCFQRFSPLTLHGNKANARKKNSTLHSSIYLLCECGRVCTQFHVCLFVCLLLWYVCCRLIPTVPGADWLLYPLWHVVDENLCLLSFSSTAQIERKSSLIRYFCCCCCCCLHHSMSHDTTTLCIYTLYQS